MNNATVVRGLYRALLRSAYRVERRQQQQQQPRQQGQRRRRTGLAAAHWDPESFAASQTVALAGRYSLRFKGRLLRAAAGSDAAEVTPSEYVRRAFRDDWPAGGGDSGGSGDGVGLTHLQRSLEGLKGLTDLAEMVELVASMRGLLRRDATPAEVLEQAAALGDDAALVAAEISRLADDAALQLEAAQSAAEPAAGCPFAFVAAVNSAIYDRGGFSVIGAGASVTVGDGGTLSSPSLGQALASRCGDALTLTAVWLAVARQLQQRLLDSDGEQLYPLQVGVAQYPTRTLVRLDLSSSSGGGSGGGGSSSRKSSSGGRKKKRRDYGSVKEGSLWAGLQPFRGDTPTRGQMCVVRMRRREQQLVDDGEEMEAQLLTAGTDTRAAERALAHQPAGTRVGADGTILPRALPTWLRGPIDPSRESHRWWYVDPARGGELVPEEYAHTSFTARGWLRGGKGWQRHATAWTAGETGQTVGLGREEAGQLRAQAAGAAGSRFLLRTGLERAMRRALSSGSGSGSGGNGGGGSGAGAVAGEEESAELRLRWKLAIAEILKAEDEQQQQHGQQGRAAAAAARGGGINLGTGTSQWAARMYPPTDAEGVLPRRSSAGLPNHNNR
eukprot:COSAG06_NODE_6033_length_3143_cov_63.039750_3_plen_613_part_00